MPKREFNPDLPGRCQNCLLPNAPIVQGWGVGEGLLVLGEAPGGQEQVQGRPFVGPAGQLLRKTLQQAGLDPDNDVFYTNSILCRPPGNKFPGIAGIQCCSDRLEEEIHLVRPKKILCTGGVALTAARHESKLQKITEWTGRGFWSEWPILRGLPEGSEIYTVPTYHPSAVLRDTDLFRDFADDIYKWLHSERPNSLPKIENLVPKTADEALRCIHRVQAYGELDNTLSCDLETWGTNPIYDSIISFGLGALTDRLDGNGQVIGISVTVPFFLLTDLVVSEVRKILKGQTYSGDLVFHNAKFDLQFLVDERQKLRIDPSKIKDTLLEHYALDERPIGHYRAHGLKTLARRRYDAPDYEFDFEVFNRLSREDQLQRLPTLLEYQSKDLYYTLRLHQDLTREIREDSPKLQSLLDNTLIPGTLAFTEIELRGIRIDLPYLLDLKSKTEESLKLELEDIKALGKQFGIEDFNPNSPKQVSDLVYKTWKLPAAKVTGDVSGSRAKSRFTTNRTVMHAHSVKAQGEIKKGLTAIVNYRQKAKNLKTYIDGILKRVDPDGRIRTDFRIAGTATGRLSSSNPNLQNFPQLLGTEIRKAFVPSPGYIWVEADYAQLELRIAADFCRDQQLIQTFIDGRDIHREVAARMFSKHPDDVDDFDRDLAKRADFGILYGRTAKALVEGSEFEFIPEGKHWWTLEEATYFLQAFLDAYPDLRDYMQSEKDKLMARGYIETPLGRRRRFPLRTQKEDAALRRQGFNAPVQGTASDVCLHALVRLHRELPEDCHVLFSVHDAIYLQLPAYGLSWERPWEVPDKLLSIFDQIKTIMVDPKTIPYPCSVPLDTKLKYGPRWGEARPEKEWKELGAILWFLSLWNLKALVFSNKTLDNQLASVHNNR